MIILACGETLYLEGNVREVFLKLYEEGSYRFYIEKIKKKTGEGCELSLRDLVKEREIQIKLKEDCFIFSEKTFLEIGGEYFTPPSEGRILQNFELRKGLYIWVYSVPERRERGGGVIFVPMPWGGIDLGRYGDSWGRYGGK